MSLAFISQFKKIESVNEQMITTIVSGKTSKQMDSKIEQVEEFINAIVMGSRSTYTSYYYSLKSEKEKVAFNEAFNEEMKEGKLLEYALQVLMENGRNYMNYYYSNSTTLKMNKLVLFQSEFDRLYQRYQVTMGDLMEDENIAKVFYSPLGYCDNKLEIPETADRNEVIQQLCIEKGVVNLAPELYVEKWSKNFDS
ncbi:hypothetical protein HCJ33_10270 [Listeria seeligeri]|uniref:hypothetical protein n=1 Tax=Listeria seeligeri TaxID=1640 RepID=UPI00162647E0|nr:hypothetical protein [Listeria seeligeri]MBC1990352.1 hypothetical protein [Listeria seeligeri]